MLKAKLVSPTADPLEFEARLQYPISLAKGIPLETFANPCAFKMISPMRIPSKERFVKNNPGRRDIDLPGPQDLPLIKIVISAMMEKRESIAEGATRAVSIQTKDSMSKEK